MRMGDAQISSIRNEMHGKEWADLVAKISAACELSVHDQCDRRGLVC